VTADQALGVLERDGYLWDIGQLDREALNKLRGLVRRGEVVRTKAIWPYFSYGTVEKTYYVREDRGGRGTDVAR